jgi:hypothetical protein
MAFSSSSERDSLTNMSNNCRDKGSFQKASSSCLGRERNCFEKLLTFILSWSFELFTISNISLVNEWFLPLKTLTTKKTSTWQALSIQFSFFSVSQMAANDNSIKSLSGFLIQFEIQANFFFCVFAFDIFTPVRHLKDWFT